MKRQLALLGFALGALDRRRARTIAVTVALTVVIAALASTVALTDALRAEARRGVDAMPDLTVSTLVAGRPGFVSVQNAVRVVSIEGVASVRARVWGYVFLDGLASNVAVVGIAPDDHGALPALIDGHAPGAGEHGWAIVGEGLARTVGVRPGDVLALGPIDGPSVTVHIAARFRAPSALTTADVVLLDERDARTLLDMPAGAATDLAVSLGNADEANVAAAKIRAVLPMARIVDKRALARTYDLTYGTRGGLVVLGLIPALIALLVLAWDRATGLSSGERREVGVLKLVGWSTSDVVTARLMESVVISTVAALTGSALAYGYVFGLRAPGLLGPMLGWSALYPPFALVPAPDGASSLAVAAMALAPYLAASTVPAWRAATIDPAEALRG